MLVVAGPGIEVVVVVVLEVVVVVRKREVTMVVDIFAAFIGLAFMVVVVVVGR
jgi:hypothetical protein